MLSNPMLRDASRQRLPGYGDLQQISSMARLFLVSAVLIVIGVLAPRSASAATIELGATSTRITPPTCPSGVAPSNCTIIMTRTTSLQTISAGIASPTIVRSSGTLVAFTVGLAALSETDITGLDQAYGGQTRVAITVLRQVGAPVQNRWAVAARSPAYIVQPHLGSVYRIQLKTGLPVEPGEVIALTTPTWAPVLSIGLSSSGFEYRASRAACTDYSLQTAQLSIGATADYRCFYVATRVEYSATEVEGASTILPSFTLSSVVSAVRGHPNELKVLRLVVIGIPPNAIASGGCYNCTLGRGGIFKYGKRTRTRLVLRVQGSILFTTRTRILLGITSTGAIGRFRLYGVRLAPPRLIATAKGCTPPGVTVSFSQAANINVVPQVPC
jgi:hypothetical protein